MSSDVVEAYGDNNKANVIRQFQANVHRLDEDQHVLTENDSLEHHICREALGTGRDKSRRKRESEPTPSSYSKTASH